MNFTVDSSLRFVCSDSELKGVVRAAASATEDMQSIFGSAGGVCSIDSIDERFANIVIFGTATPGTVPDMLEKSGFLPLDDIRGRREVYKMRLIASPFKNTGKTLVIAGSDKRGTIYGLYKFSELCGVSPLRKWSGCAPKQADRIELEFSAEIISREPSVKYRGIFINDEWPAFGNWANIHFGGINAKCYEGIFELILRLKGNYFWPAMWSSCFSLDGPDLASAELADEMGIVMSTSHHEPCMRAGAEYQKMRGKTSPYGDAWDFRSNREGITKFWADGLKRNARFENVITLGMRGENDTAIMRDASLEDNISLLRDVLHTQNELIRQTVNSDISAVPRQIVLHNEVEKFYYGDDEHEGLYSDPELDGVCVVLGDANCGYTKSLPAREMLSRSGGYGMYYHIDMHGGPYAYEWVGNSLLPRMWEQMSMAYDYGVSEIWVVNVGDIATQELALSYFLDLAYDFDRYGTQNPNSAGEYINTWLHRQFNGFAETDIADMARVTGIYIKICERRKQEIMNDTVYHPVHFGETDELITDCETIVDICERIKRKYPEDQLTGFWELIYYPCVGTANLMKTWCFSSKNRLYAAQNRNEANLLADRVKDGIEFDRALTDKFHSVANGKFGGFGLSEHFGFTHWNEEDCKYPLRIYTEPANKPRIIVCKSDETNYCIGKPWSGNQLVFNDFLRPDIHSVMLDIACGSKNAIEYSLSCSRPWLSFSKTQGRTKSTDRIAVFIDRTAFTGKDSARIIVSEKEAQVEITVNAENKSFENYADMTFIEYDGYIAMEAEHYRAKHGVDTSEFKLLKPYGRSGSAMKVYPSTADFRGMPDKPYLEYLFEVKSAGIYELELSFAPSCPITAKPSMLAGISINGSEEIIFETIKDSNAFYPTCSQCTEESRNNVKQYRRLVECKQGVNLLRYYHVSPNLAIERILLHKQGSAVPESYLGAKESFFVRQKPIFRPE